MLKKGLAVAVILLFIGVAFAPSINAVDEPVPDLDCRGSLYWDGRDLEPGDVLTGDFTVGNIGEPNSELEWRIISCPFWGTWTFDPESGTGLTPEDGFVFVDVEFILAVEVNETIGGEIGIQNVDDENDICYIDIVIQKKSDEDCGCEDESTLEGDFPVICILLLPLYSISWYAYWLGGFSFPIQLIYNIGTILGCMWVLESAYQRSKDFIETH